MNFPAASGTQGVEIKAGNGRPSQRLAAAGPEIAAALAGGAFSSPSGARCAPSPPPPPGPGTWGRHRGSQAHASLCCQVVERAGDRPSAASPSSASLSARLSDGVGPGEGLREGPAVPVLWAGSTGWMPTRAPDPFLSLCG